VRNGCEKKEDKSPFPRRSPKKKYFLGGRKRSEGFAPTHETLGPPFRLVITAPPVTNHKLAGRLGRKKKWAHRNRERGGTNGKGEVSQTESLPPPQKRKKKIKTAHQRTHKDLTTTTDAKKIGLHCA